MKTNRSELKKLIGKVVYFTGKTFHIVVSETKPEDCTALRYTIEGIDDENLLVIYEGKTKSRPIRLEYFEEVIA